MNFPTLFALGALSVAVLTRDLLGFSDMVINRGLGAATVAWVAFYQTVPLAARMLPFATLIGCLVGLGRLGADREILILEASGVSSPRLLGPVLVFASVMTTIGLGLSLFAAPWSNRVLDRTLFEIAQRAPGTTIQGGQVNHFGDWKIEAREVSASGQDLRGVFLWMADVGETVFAERATLAAETERGIRLTLEKGTLIPNPRKRPRELRFDQMTTYLPESDEPVTRSFEDQLGGETLLGLARIARTAGEETALDAQMELHRRFTLPFATLVFGFLAVPLFFSRGHFSRSGGGVLGIGATVVYYGLVQLAEGLIRADQVGVAVGMWLPNLVLGALAVVLVLRLQRTTAFGRHSDRPSSPRAWSKAKEDASEGEAGVRERRWSLARYVASRFAQLALLCFLVLLAGYLLVDVLERLSMFAGYGATGVEVIRYYGARIPLLASRVIPMALLVATALTVSLLAVQGELMGMRSCGIPAPRALLPILVICSVIAPLYFLLNNEVLPYTNALQKQLKEIEIKNESERRTTTSIWYRADHSFYEAELFDPQAGTARNLTVYELGEDWLPTSRMDARSARHIGGGVWRLVDPIRVEIEQGVLRQVPAAPFSNLGGGVRAEVDTRHLSVGQLRKEIEDLESSDLDATAYRVDYWVKIATPVACLVLPAVALFFAVGGPPHPSSGLTLVGSVVVSITYVLLSGVGTSLGYGKALPPFVAGWAPVAVFAGIAGYLGLRLRGFGQTF